METSYRLDERDRLALVYLRHLALHGGGYERRGVRGWALRDDVEEGTGVRLTERFPRLHSHGLLDREDVRAPAHQRPLWIWRITPAGVRRIEELEGLPRGPVPPPLDVAVGPADATIYVPGRSLLALLELQRALEMRVTSPHLPGEPGWRTLQELRVQSRGGEDQGQARGWKPPVRREPWRSEPTEAWEPEVGSDERGEGPDDGWDPLYGDLPDTWQPHPFWLEDLDWLVRAGLAQRWGVKPEGRRPLVLFRATSLGGVAIPLQWEDPG